MRKQTKLVAVLSTAALLAIGASMTSFAAQGWAEEDGTWVYYNRDGERATEQWKKSGNNWYYLDSDGEMAIDTLIEDGDNYYYVDINGVMASNQWVAIENEDAGDDDEPDNYWYYFQANGKALKNSGDNVSLKTINGKKYAFDDEGKMLYGWVASDNAERIDNTDGDAFKDGVYYFGGADDGAMTVGWLQMDITYEEATNDEYKYVAPVFTDDEDQSRWFYFKSNGKKYAFDQNGAMVAEWSMDETKVATADMPATPGKASTAKYSQAWRYFNSVEDGSRVSKGWFKVVSAEYLNDDKYNDDEDSWYYADGSGNLYAGEFKTIKGKKYAFRNDGRMIDGLKFIKPDDLTKVYADDDSDHPFDTEDDFIDSALWYAANGYNCYYFGDGNDGAMKTNKTNITIDGDNFNFYFEKSGSSKGAGVNGEKDDKYYLGGMLLKAGSDDKYQAIEYVEKAGEEKGWKKLADAQAVIKKFGLTSDTSKIEEAKKAASSFNKKADDLKELYILPEENNNLKLINTSGKVIDKKGKSKDGNDYVYVTDNKGVIRVIYVEN